MRWLALVSVWVSLVMAPQAMAEEVLTPEAVVQAYYTRLAAGDFGAYADVIHPDEAARFKSMLVDMFRMAEEEGDHRLVASTFGPGATIEDVEKSTPTEFVRAFMGLTAAMLGGMEFSGIEVLGNVPEGEMHHVVVRARMKAEGVEITQMEVVSTKPYEGQPRLMLTGNWEGLGAAMKARAAQRQAEATPAD